MKEPNVARPKNVRLVARVVCFLADGTSCTLYATRLTLSSVTIIALRPLAVGDRLELALHPLRQRPLPTLRATVTRSRNDFAAGEWNDFEATFLDPSEDEVDRLVTAIIGIDDVVLASPRFVERRGTLRVPTNLAALAETSAERCRAVISDLSLTGALLCLPRNAPEGMTALDALVRLTIAYEPLAGALRLRGRIAWSTAGPAQQLVGIRFTDCDSPARALLHEIALRELAAATEARFLPLPRTERPESTPPPDSGSRPRGGGAAA